MSQTKRILHIAPGEPFGGVQRVVLNLRQEQACRHQVAVLWTGEARRAQCEDTDGLYAHGTLAARIIMARHAVREFNPDIIHLHMAPPWIFFALLGEPAVVCFHLHCLPSQAKGLNGWIVSTLERWMIARSEMLIAISDWIEARWRLHYPEERYRKVFNGILAGSGSGMIRMTDETEPGLIGFASRLAADKGVGEFAAFVLAMHERLPSVRFRVAGDGPERNLLERKLSSLIAAGKVELLGHIMDMPAFWTELDLAIFTAPSEPFGLRLIEPVAESVPVIAYKTGAGSDEIAFNCAGIATVPYEETESMVELAAQLLDEPEQRRWMVREGKKDVARKFSIEAMSAGIERAYAEVIDTAERRKR